MPAGKLRAFDGKGSRGGGGVQLGAFSMSCTRWLSCCSARSPAIPSASMSDSGSVGTDEKHDCTRNAPPSTTAKISAPIRVIHDAENAPAAGAVSRVQLGIGSFQIF